MSLDILGANWLQPWLLISLTIAIVAYGWGTARLRRQTGSRIIGNVAIAAFLAGIGTIALALSSPADRIADDLFSAHMIQHLLLMLAAAPLLVFARVPLALLWLLPLQARQALAGGIGRSAVHTIRWLRSPLIAWTLYTGVFIFWHLPGPYARAYEDETIHALEHASFLLSAFGFWSVVIEPSGRRVLEPGATILYVTTSAIIGSFPGALMILTDHAFYRVHVEGVAHWGLTLVQDQQLAGLIMWIPAGLAYLGAISALFIQWLRTTDAASSRKRLRSSGLLAVATIMGLSPLLWAGKALSQSSNAAVNDPRRGAELITAVGCGSCHIIPGIVDANGLVGPPLDHMARRIYIAGLLRNGPENMIQWLRFPQRIVPGNAMPDLGLNAEDAGDIAAYLATLK